MKYFLGIDGGGTKTAYTLTDERGRILASHTGSTIDFNQVGIDGMESTIKEGVAAVLQTTGTDASSLIHTFVGLPAYGEFADDMPAQENALNRLFQGQVTISNDAVAGWAGSLAAKPGINMVLGTGAICFGQDEQGNQARTGGWGPTLGDEGSANWLGREAIRLFARQSDGRSKENGILHTMRQHLSLKQDFDLIAVADALTRKEMAALAMVIHEAALAGDKDAINAYVQAANEAVDCVVACKDRLQFEEKPITVSFSGGVLKANDLIKKPLEERLAKEGQYRYIEPMMSPAKGAALMALLAGGIPYHHISLEEMIHG